MTALVTGTHMSELHGSLGRAFFVVAEEDILSVSGALVDAARRGALTDLRAQQHALSGICRLFGADTLEQAAFRPLLSETEIASFEACVSATIGALRDFAATCDEERSTDHGG